jgi:hypothetical protein
MKVTIQRGTVRNRLTALFALVALTCGAWAQTPGYPVATEKAGDVAHQNANLGLGRGAAPLPEPGTWIAMGTLLVAAAALIAREKRRRTNG